jgi:hypothetical protein
MNSHCRREQEQQQQQLQQQRWRRQQHQGQSYRACDIQLWQRLEVLLHALQSEWGPLLCGFKQGSQC